MSSIWKPQTPKSRCGKFRRIRNDTRRYRLQSDWPDRSTLPNTRGLLRVIRTRAQNPIQFPVSDSFRRDVSARKFAVAGAKHLVENQSRRIKQAKDGRRDGLP